MFIYTNFTCVLLLVCLNHVYLCLGKTYKIRLNMNPVVTIPYTHTSKSTIRSLRYHTHTHQKVQSGRYDTIHTHIKKYNPVVTIPYTHTSKSTIRSLRYHTHTHQKVQPGRYDTIHTHIKKYNPVVTIPYTHTHIKKYNPVVTIPHTHIKNYNQCSFFTELGKKTTLIVIL